MNDELKKKMEEFVQNLLISDDIPNQTKSLPENINHAIYGFQVCHDLMKKDYDKLKAEHEILKSRASQFESTILETIKYRDKAIEALKEINRKEMNSLRPGGSPSEVARISYEVLKEINRTKED